MNISAQVTPPPPLPQLLYQWRNSTWYLSARRLGVPTPDPNVVEKENALSCQECNLSCLAYCYICQATPAHKMHYANYEKINR